MNEHIKTMREVAATMRLCVSVPKGRHLSAAIDVASALLKELNDLPIKVNNTGELVAVLGPEKALQFQIKFNEMTVLIAKGLARTKVRR